MTRPLVDGSDQPLAAVHDVALLDLDGVALRRPGRGARRAGGPRGAPRPPGMRPAYVTNNAARTPETVAEHLRELGVPADATDVVTSAQAAATLVAERVAGRLARSWSSAARGSSRR